jgi:hypothetical protein
MEHFQSFERVADKKEETKKELVSPQIDCASSFEKSR